MQGCYEQKFPVVPVLSWTRPWFYSHAHKRMKSSDSKPVKCTGSLPVMMCDICTCIMHTVEVFVAFLVDEQELVVFSPLGEAVSEQPRSVFSWLFADRAAAEPWFWHVLAGDSAQGLMVTLTQQDAWKMYELIISVIFLLGLSGQSRAIYSRVMPFN